MKEPERKPASTRKSTNAAETKSYMQPIHNRKHCGAGGTTGDSRGASNEKHVVVNRPSLEGKKESIPKPPPSMPSKDIQQRKSPRAIPKPAQPAYVQPVAPRKPAAQLSSFAA